MSEEEILDLYRSVIYGKLLSETEKNRKKAIDYAGSWETFEKNALDILNKKSEIIANNLKENKQQNEDKFKSSAGRPRGFLTGIWYDLQQIWRK